MSYAAFHDHAVAEKTDRLTALGDAINDETFRRLAQLGLRPDARCLDIGSGTGPIATLLHRHSHPDDPALEQQPPQLLVVAQRLRRTDAFARALPSQEGGERVAQSALLMIEGRRVVIGPGGATIGRGRQADVVLNDPNVSRQHAEIRPRGGSWVITDLGSTNGSQLNGRRIDGSEVLREGDEIELGASVLTFSLE